MTRRRSVSALLAVGLLSGCGTDSDTVFYPLSIEFDSAASSVPEGTEAASVSVRLNAPASVTVSVDYSVRDITASGHDACNTRDYSLESGTLHFEPGATSASLDLRHLDDDLAEIDEQLRIELSSPEGARLGTVDQHLHTISDDDRELLVDVRADFDAQGDGETDDTARIQAALDRTALSSAAVLLLPPGVYQVTSLELTAGLSLYGYGATLRQAPEQPEDAQLLRVTHAADEDSPLTLVQGLTFDGDREAQGEFADWQYQESDLFAAGATPTRAGRIVLVAEDLTFENTGGNGLLLGPNSDSTVCQLQGHEVFTDLLKLGGGNSRLEAREVAAAGSIGTTSIAITGQPQGYDARNSVEVTLEDITLADGDLEIDVRDASTVTARRVVVDEAPFYLRAVRSSVRISDSSLAIGPPLYRFNRIVAPHDVRFDRSTFTLREISERTVTYPESDRELVLFGVTWDNVDHAFADGEPDTLVEPLSGQTLRFDDCEFRVGADVEPSDTTYVAGNALDAGEGSDNRIVIHGGRVDPAFDAVFAPGACDCEQTP
ncbi:MAG TPA: Calx-beta domain-containing protein [Polyangiaceae bacterium]